VLPNNKNIVLAAKQAADLIKGKKIHVLNTASVPQGIAAMIAFVPGESVQDNLASMKAAAGSIVTGQVTYAVRDVELEGRVISQGDILGIVEGEIIAGAKKVSECAAMVLAQLMEGNPDLISVYAGEEVSGEEADALVNSLQAGYPDVEVEFHRGDQPLYYYIFSAE